jgi:predicted DNA binding CopG/RHH family protein
LYRYRKHHNYKRYNVPTAAITNNTGSTVITCSTTAISVTATGGVSYSWDGGATPATAENSFSAPGTYTVTVTGANGCTATESITITKDDNVPTAAITNNTGSTVITCSTTAISVTATGGVSYSWDGGATPATAENSFSAPGTYTVTVTGANGCTATESITITKDDNVPTAAITNNTGSTVITCSTTAISVTATGGVSYSWDGGATPATAENSFSAPGTYTVTVTGANGCTATESITITKDDNVPTAAITNNTGSTVITCSTTAISVTATGGVSYSWDGGATPATAENSFSAPGTYTVTVTGANGCTATESITITKDDNVPTAAITNNTGSTVITCSTTAISVTATGGVSYSWDGGATPATAENSFSAPGTYTVTVTGANGCTATESITITKDDNVPTAAITNNTGSTVITCSTTAISVTATGGVSYSWDGGATPATAENSFSAPGTYTVTVTGANGCTATESITITKDDNVPTAAITNNTGSTVITCSTTAISVTATGGVSYSWDGGATPATAENSFSAPGTYTVTVTGANGCTATESITITKDDNVPTAAITNNTGSTVITCSTTAISVTATGGVSYSWDGGATPATAENSFSAPGTYTVTVTGANGCTATESITITKDDNVPTAAITNNTGSTVITCSTTAISVTATGGVSYSWDGGATPATAENSFSAPGTYTVTVTGANGCTATESITITKDDNVPTAAITNNTGSTVITCSTTAISVTATGGVSYSWDGGATPATAENSFSAPGTYTVTVTGANGCTATESITINEPKAVIKAVADIGTANGYEGGMAVQNVLANDLINGIPVLPTAVIITSVSDPDDGVTLNTFTGAVTVDAVTPAGTYQITYQICEICEKNNNSNCDQATVTVTVSSATIDAVADAGSANGFNGGTAVQDVLANDLLNGVTVLPADVNTSFVSSTNGSISLVGTSVVVAAGTPAGTYELVYQICEKLNPTNCDQATVTVTVSSATIDAVADAGSANGFNGGTAVQDVLANDLLNGVTVLPADVNTSFVSSTNGGISLVGTSVVVAAGTPAGTYELVYQICEKLNPTNCDQATVTVTVSSATIDAVADAGSANGFNGGTAVQDVLANDLLNGVTVLPADVNTSFVSSTNGGISLVGTSVVVAAGTPAGTYELVYQICEKLNPTNCDQATVTVTVSSATIDAVADAGSANGFNGGTAVQDVLANDLLNGVTVLPADVNTSFVSSTNGGISLVGTSVVVAAGTPAGTYELVYQICEKLNPTNCDQAVVRIVVLPPSDVVIDAVDDEFEIYNDEIAEGSITINDITSIGNIVINTTPLDAPNNGTVVINTDGTMIYTPDIDFSGVDSFSYQICNSILPTICDKAVVTIFVLDSDTINPAPFTPCDDFDVFIPNGFSPNDDIINDYFIVSLVCNDGDTFAPEFAEKYPNAKVEIFNRWGNMVYQKENFGNIDRWGAVLAWWDGSSNSGWTVGGDKLPAGTYFYILYFNDEEKEPKAGSVFLNR